MGCREGKVKRPRNVEGQAERIGGSKLGVSRVFVLQGGRGATRSLTLKTTAQLPFALHSRVRHLLARAVVRYSLSFSLPLSHPLYCTRHFFVFRIISNLLFSTIFDILTLITLIYNVMFKTSIYIFLLPLHIFLSFSYCLVCSLFLLSRAKIFDR